MIIVARLWKDPDAWIIVLMLAVNAVMIGRWMGV